MLIFCNGMCVVRRSLSYRIASQSHMLQQLAAAAEARIRLDAFVAAHSSMHNSSAPAHPAVPAEAADDAVLRCFVSCVELLLNRHTRDVQALPGRVKRQREQLRALQASFTSFFAPSSRSLSGGADAPTTSFSSATSSSAAREERPLTPLELCVYSPAVQSQLFQLARLCRCEPAKGWQAAQVLPLEGSRPAGTDQVRLTAPWQPYGRAVYVAVIIQCQVYGIR